MTPNNDGIIDLLVVHSRQFLHAQQFRLPCLIYNLPTSRRLPNLGGIYLKDEPSKNGDVV